MRSTREVSLSIQMVPCRPDNRAAKAPRCANATAPADFVFIDPRRPAVNAYRCRFLRNFASVPGSADLRACVENSPVDRVPPISSMDLFDGLAADLDVLVTLLAVFIRDVGRDDVEGVPTGLRMVALIPRRHLLAEVIGQTPENWPPLPAPFRSPDRRRSGSGLRDRGKRGLSWFRRDHGPGGGGLSAACGGRRNGDSQFGLRSGGGAQERRAVMTAVRYRRGSVRQVRRTHRRWSAACRGRSSFGFTSGSGRG